MPSRREPASKRCVRVSPDRRGADPQTETLSPLRTAAPRPVRIVTVRPGDRPRPRTSVPPLAGRVCARFGDPARESAEGPPGPDQVGRRTDRRVEDHAREGGESCRFWTRLFSAGERGIGCRCARRQVESLGTDLSERASPPRSRKSCKSSKTSIPTSPRGRTDLPKPPAPMLRPGTLRRLARRVSIRRLRT